jgi:chemotaxis protein methyltransferase CheR
MPALTPQLFGLLTSLVEERVGLHWSLTELPLFADKLESRLVETGFESALDYYYFLRYDPRGEDEFRALVDALVVGETYLYREATALEAAIDHVIRPAIASRQRARVWSAGCATGEEPFTLAMMLAGAGLLAEVEIIATDVSGRSLARAASGRLPPRSLRAFAPESPTALRPAWRDLAGRWLVDQPNGGAVVRPELVRAIRFAQGSLVGAPPPPGLRDLDLILCRNVLIYFKDATVREVVETFASRLLPSGRLLVGASESLLRFGTVLRCEERAGAFLYGKEPNG